MIYRFSSSQHEVESFNKPPKIIRGILFEFPVQFFYRNSTLRGFFLYHRPFRSAEKTSVHLVLLAKIFFIVSKSAEFSVDQRSMCRLEYEIDKSFI